MLRVSLHTRLAVIGILATVSSSAVADSVDVQSAPRAEHRPQICTGYRPMAPLAPEFSWGSTPGSFYCKRNEAMYFANPSPVSAGLPPEKVRFAPGCCPLPAEDILEAEVMTVPEECPADYVAVGLVPKVASGRDALTTLNDADVDYDLRCRKINTQRYRLTEATPGAYWGFGSNYFWQQTHYARTDIPPAIRAAAGRSTRLSWEPAGCVGSPVGSVLTKKESKRCHGLYFKQLQYRGLEGDPAEGTPVKMFPDCRDVSDFYDPLASCIAF